MTCLSSMKFYKIAFLEACFNKGYGTTAPLKYLVALIGISNAIVTERMLATAIAGFGYVIFCFILGYILYSVQYVDAQMEVGNRFNPYIKEMRNSKIFKH